MTKDELINYFGTSVNTARALGISSSTITRWKRVPTWHQTNAQHITKGKLKADKIIPKTRTKHTTTKACFTIPTDLFIYFKKHCQENNISMSEKITQFVELELMEF